MKKYWIIIILLPLYLPVLATHIVGGFISYRHISDNTYEVKLTVYRDCNSTTPLDGNGNVNDGVPAAKLWVYRNNQYVDSILLGRPVIQRIDPPIDNPCLTNTGNVCVEQGIYTTRYTFPSSTGTYDVEYVRCCRNGSINNLFRPGDQGAMYSVTILPGLHNSSPVFNRFPPTFICLDAPLRFDHSATDADGDRLEYSLCTPYVGGDQYDPSPSFPGYHLYTVDWQNRYSASNPFGNNSLAIDPNTGYMTGRPNDIGQFVVGVCVSEYRNGTLIGTYLRDFQFNVTQCNIPFADVPASRVNPVSNTVVYELNCKNYTVNFKNNSYNPPPTSTPLNFSWDFGVAGTTSDVSTDATPTFTYPDTGTYRVRLIASKGSGSSYCGDTTYAFVQVYPTFKTDFSTGNICQDSAAVFSDLSFSTFNNTNYWKWNFGDGITSSVASLKHNYNVPGTYQVSLISGNGFGCRDTVQKSITIYPVPSADYTFSNTCEDIPVNFNLNNIANTSSYNWSFPGGATFTTPNPSYTFTTPGTYTVNVFLRNTDGCKDTVSKTITVHPTPLINLTPDTTICANTSVQLHAEGGSTYTWTPPTNLNSASIANPLATPPPFASKTYTVRVVDQYQCENTDSVKISFFPLSIIDAGLDTSVCLNPGSRRDSVQLHATGGSNYSWSPVSGLDNPLSANPVSRPVANTTYFLNATDIYSCKYTDSVKVYFLDPSLNLIVQDAIEICERDTGYANIIDQGASEYNWSPTQYLTTAGRFNTGFFPPDTAFYVLTVQNYCYTKSDTILVAVSPLPRLALNPLDSICIGESIQLMAHDAESYSWNNDPSLSAFNVSDPLATPTVTSTYYVKGTSDKGCVNRDSTTILVYSPSILKLEPSSLPFICQGDSVQLLATGAYTYEWSPSSSLKDPGSDRPVARPADTTTYIVNATNVHGCKSSDSLIINVQLPVTASAVSPVEACEGIPIQLSATGGFYYQWSPPTGLNNRLAGSPFFIADTSRIYTVKVSNDCFSDFATVVVNVHPLPFVDAGNDTLMWRDTYAILSGSTAVSTHYWSPSTWLDEPYELATKAEPEQTTRYELFAVDEYGCVNKDSVVITVEGYTVLAIPTAFTPNGDGVNDLFRVAKWLNIEKIKDFSVYDRWGIKVFSTNNIEAGWDGTMGGKEQPLGSYVWVLVAQTKDGEEIQRKGNVTLLR